MAHGDGDPLACLGTELERGARCAASNVRLSAGRPARQRWRRASFAQQHAPATRCNAHMARLHVQVQHARAMRCREQRIALACCILTSSLGMC